MKQLELDRSYIPISDQLFSPFLTVVHKTDGACADLPIPIFERKPLDHTLRLLDVAEKVGVYGRMMDGKDGYDLSKIREGINIVDEYYRTDSVLSDIGQRHYMSKNEAMRRRNKTLRSIIDHLPDDVKDGYRFEELTLSKPRPLNSRLRTSIARGSNIFEIARSVRHGTPALSIADKFDLDTNKMSKRRKRLKDLGVSLPHFVKGLDTFDGIKAAASNKNLSDDDAKCVVAKVTESFFKKNHGKTGVLASLKECVETAGFKFNPQYAKFYEDALFAIIPVGCLDAQKKNGRGELYSYKIRFILRQHLERAVEALMQNEQLSRFRVS